MASNSPNYWMGSGDGVYQKAVDEWANERYGEDWRLRCEVYNMEASYDKYISNQENIHTNCPLD